VAAGSSELEIPLETFSKVVEAVYDCALDPARWDSTVKQIADLCASQLSLFAVHDYANGRSELSFGLGYTDHFIRLHEEKYSAMNPFFAVLWMLPIGAVRTRAMMVDDTEFYESRFYREWVKPQGFDDAIGFSVLQTDRRIGWWTAHRLETCPRYGDAEVRLMSLLSPHICRAVKISPLASISWTATRALST
jgi:hypothetical protein